MPLYVHEGIPAVAKINGIKTVSDKPSPASSHLRIGLVNLMPLKEMTEEDFFRLLSETEIDADIDLIQMESHESRNTSHEHLQRHYNYFRNVKHLDYDGIIITGAPVEKIDFEEVDYWHELTELMDWTRLHKIPTLYICWAAFAGLYHHYRIAKHILNTKISGVFPHDIHFREKPLFEGLDSDFFIPHSRYATFHREDIMNHPLLSIESESSDSGVYIVEASGGLEFYITGHSEYALETLDFEYHRDLAKGMNPKIPKNYYPDNNPSNRPLDRWSKGARRLFSNWLLHYANKRKN